VSVIVKSTSSDGAWYYSEEGGSTAPKTRAAGDLRQRRWYHPAIAAGEPDVDGDQQ
jgi:hypothetical protein